MSNIAIITARSGSKGLKDKNIKELCGKPLISYSIEAAINCKLFEKVMVSTDSEIYAEIGKKYGAEVPFLRSSRNSDDTASSWDVVKEVLARYADMGYKYDTIALLQPTSPLRSSQDIIDGYKLMEEKKADSITAVCEMEHSPLWSNTLPENLSMKDFERKEYDCPRQQLPLYYRINGALYLRKISYIGENIQILNENEYALIMPQNRSIDIDAELDFSIAEVLMMRR